MSKQSNPTERDPSLMLLRLHWLWCKPGTDYQSCAEPLCAAGRQEIARRWRQNQAAKATPQEQEGQ